MSTTYRLLSDHSKLMRTQDGRMVVRVALSDYRMQSANPKEVPQSPTADAAPLVGEVVAIRNGGDLRLEANGPTFGGGYRSSLVRVTSLGAPFDRKVMLRKECDEDRTYSGTIAAGTATERCQYAYCEPVAGMVVA